MVFVYNSAGKSALNQCFLSETITRQLVSRW